MSDRLRDTSSLQDEGEFVSPEKGSSPESYALQLAASGSPNSFSSFRCFDHFAGRKTCGIIGRHCFFCLRVS